MMKTTQLPDASSGGHSGARARWARALVGAAVLLLLAPPAWATRVTDVRVGKHPTFTRVVFELDSPSGYQLERNEPADGIAELVVSLRAGASGAPVVTPKNSLIERIELRSDGKATTAHIRLVKGGLRLKEMMLSSPARIVLDLVDDPAEKAAAPKPAPVAISKPKPAPAPVVSEPVAVVSEPEVVEVVEAAVEHVAEAASELADEQGASPASPSPYGDRESAPAAAIEFRSDEGASDSTAPYAEAEPVVPAKPVQIAMATPQEQIAPDRKARTTLPAASSTNVVNRTGSGLFSMRNGAYALAGVGLLGAAGFVLARRRRDVADIEDDYDEDALGEENPFAGLESAEDAEDARSPHGASAYDDTTDEGGIAVAEFAEDENGQTDFFAGTPSAVEQGKAEPEIVRGGGAGSNDPNYGTTAAAATEGSDMSMDGTTSFGASATKTSSMPPMGGLDTDAVMRLIRELETRIADVETRLEETVDAKERLERQVAAQTEELRVQRAAIARTQRAVRNMSQPVEDTPTEPALREPRSED